MANNSIGMSWEDFCGLYYETAKHIANIVLAKQKKRLGKLSATVDESLVVDESVVIALEKTFKSYTTTRGAKVSTFLNTIVHNELVDILERENRAGARRESLQDAETALREQIRADALGVQREDIIKKLHSAIKKLSDSDKVIIYNYLENRSTFVKKSAEKLGISENYVSVRKNRILDTLKRLMKVSKQEYYDYSLPEETFASKDIFCYKTMFQESSPVLLLEINLIDPSVSSDVTAEMLYRLVMEEVV